MAELKQDSLHIEKTLSISRSLSRISSISSGSSDNQENEQGYQSRRCGICFEKYNLSDKLPRIACERNHVLCEACIRKIVQTDRLLCPFCKAKLGNGKFKLPIQMQLLGLLQKGHSIGAYGSKTPRSQIKSSLTVGPDRNSKEHSMSMCNNPNPDVLQVLANLKEGQLQAEDLVQTFEVLNFSEQKQLQCLLELAKPSYQMLDQVIETLSNFSRHKNGFSLQNILKQFLLKGPEFAEAVVGLAKTTSQQKYDHTLCIEFIGRFRYQVGGEFDQLYSFLVSIEFLLQELLAQLTALKGLQQEPDQAKYDFKYSIQRSCISLWSIGNLALNNQWLRSFILDQGIVKPILDSLELENYQEIQLQAVKALWYLLDRNQRIQKSFVQGGLTKPLIKCLTSEDTTIRSFAISLKYQLLRNDHVNEEQLDILTIDQILKLIEVGNIQQSHKCQILKQLSEITVKNSYNKVYIRSQNGGDLIQEIAKNKNEFWESKEIAIFIQNHLKDYGQKRKKMNFEKVKTFNQRLRRIVSQRLIPTRVQLVHN